jgi:hypothetical protein
MKAIGPACAVFFLLTVFVACDNDKSTESEDKPLVGSYQGICLYTQYQGGVTMKVLSQNVEVIFEESTFRMRKDPSYSGEPREFCDIAAPYSLGSSIDIDCPEMQVDCPEWEHPCGAFSKAWKGDSLKMARDYVDSLGWRHVKSLNLLKLSR